MTGMDEYIERGALEIDLNGRLDFLWDLNGIDDHYTMGFFEAVIRAKEFPSADVAPVRHGRWMKPNSREKTYQRRCTACGSIAYFCGIGCSYKYCPNCGAKMDGSSNEE